MEKIEDYTLLEKIGETKHFHVYRSRKKDSAEPVIIKVLKIKHPTPSEIARFKQEYELISSMDYEGIVKTLDILEEKDSITIIEEDFKGEPAKDILLRRKFDLRGFLQTAVKVSKTLGKLHEKDIIHKSIKSRNISINEKSGEVKITGFGAVSIVTHGDNAIYSPEVIEQTIPYISPEQTGRMNRTIDYRTDLYSLGVTFYEMLTGSLPFKSNDPKEIIHSHIALNPAVPSKVDPDIPETVSDIIMKLLSKNAEQRYQNAFGLQADLEECLNQIDSTGRIEPFKIAQKDFSKRFNIPLILYGRKKEISTILEAFERVSKGNNEIMLVAGEPGIGKSAVINELHKPIVAKKGYFAMGKYEQFRRDVPYSAIIQAFQSLVRQILSESEDRIKVWKRNLLDVLGENGRVITEVIPEVELIIGKQPEIPALSSEASKNRFNIVFEKFARVFANAERPLALFLDDLQWIDLASLELLKNIVIHSTARFLFLVGSYRDNEVPKTHPLIDTLKQIKESGITVDRLTLPPLLLSDIKSLLKDFLKCSEEKSDALGKVILGKTGGNPFFIIQFLKTLYDEELIRYNIKNDWQWNINEINSLAVTDNVVRLLAEKINNLSDDTQNILKVASCIGNRFSLESLSFIMDETISGTLEQLTEAVNDGYVSILEDVYAFHHDRIQEAAYSLIPDEEKPALHYKIGKMELENTEKDEIDKKLFYIVDQLNLGSSLIKDDGEKEQLARMNFDAGKKAKNSAAYVPAFKYLKKSRDLLKDDCWENQYDITLAVYNALTEMAFLNGDFDGLKTFADTVEQNARTKIDKIDMYEVRILALYDQRKTSEGLSVALDYLKELEFKLPSNPSKMLMLMELVKIRLKLINRKIEELINLPVMTDPKMKTVARVLALLGVGAYQVNNNALFVLSGFKEIEIALKYGHSKEHCIHYITIAIILICMTGDIESGYKFGRLMLDLVDKFDIKEHKSQVMYMYNLLIRHWKENVKNSLSSYWEGYLSAMETGGLEWASFNLLGYDLRNFFSSYPLTDLDRDMAEHGRIVEQMKNVQVHDMYNAYRQTIKNFLGQNDNPVSMTGKAMNEEKMLSQWKETKSGTAIAIYYRCKLELCYFFEEYTKALEVSNAAQSYKMAVIATIPFRDFSLYDALIKLALYDSASRKDKRKFLRNINKELKKFKKWAVHCPENNQYRVHLLEAELARTSKKGGKAGISYALAVEESRKSGVIRYEALANELAAKFYLKEGRERIAGAYIAEAYRCYARWGAKAKLESLKKKYPELLRRAAASVRKADSDTTRILTDTTRLEGTSQLDIHSVIDASQAISREISLHRLLPKMMEIIIENAGARKGILVLKEGEELKIEAAMDIEKGNIWSGESQGIEESKDLPKSVVTYVMRTGEDVMIPGKEDVSQFVNDEYLKEHDPESLLCIPIRYKDEILGTAYLENDIVAGAFTKENRKVLETLLVQAAISIENASLYANLENKVEERTRELKEANERLAEINKELDDFTYIVSHDLKAPLKSIDSFSKFIEDDYKGKLDSDGVGYLERVRANAKKMGRMIQDLLEVSRIERQKNPFRDVEVKGIIEDILLRLEADIKEKNIKVEVKEGLPKIYCDKVRITEVFANLMSNAIKYMDKEESKLEIGSEEEEGEYRFYVRDNGPGIAKEDFDKIFGVFKRLERTKNTEGTGVGLTIVKKIVEMHKGKIWVESEVGEGTTFYFTIAKK